MELSKYKARQDVMVLIYDIHEPEFSELAEHLFDTITVHDNQWIVQTARPEVTKNGIFGLIELALVK